MFRKKRATDDKEVAKVRAWFRKSVTYAGEPYEIDMEQAAAVACDALNTIVVARAGSGKTRTIVAKIVYLIAQAKIEPSEMIAFVFNKNAADEINARLSAMAVDGVSVINNKKIKIATTFHAFARKIVYDVYDRWRECRDILADEKDLYILRIVKMMVMEPKWSEKIVDFLDVKKRVRRELAGERGKVVTYEQCLKESDIIRMAKKMEQFVDRAQQKFLGREETLPMIIDEYKKNNPVGRKESIFLEIGAECHKRYHWYLLNSHSGLRGLAGYGTDFNLIVSWASRLLERKEEKTVDLLGGKKYILIDEYQDFSQLFLTAIEAIRGIADTAKLFVVGDDWQAINRFAGSDVEYFKNFETYFGEETRRYEIATNYRCDYMIVEASRKFMKRAMEEKGRFRAKSKEAGKVVIVDPRFTLTDYVEMRGRWLGIKDELYVRTIKPLARRKPSVYTVKYFKTIVNIIKENRRARDILILHRNNDLYLEDISLVQLSHGLKKLLEKNKIMRETEYDEKVKVMTMHKSKGLEAEVVIILEADDGVIPREHSDAGIFGLFGESSKMAMDDQKRLFYVAITRAKKRLYIIHDDSTGTGFVGYLGKGIEKWEE